MITTIFLTVNFCILLYSSYKVGFRNGYSQRDFEQTIKDLDKL